MGFYARPVAELLRLFTDISQDMARGGVPAALESIRHAFGADAAILLSECRNASRAALRQVVTGAALDADAAAAFDAAPLSQQSCPQFRGFEQLTTLCHEDAGSMRYALALYRREDIGGFTPDDQMLADNILPQFVRSIEEDRRRQRADIERKLYSGIVERLQIGLIVLDRAGRIMSLSALAEEVLENRDGLHVVKGKLCAPNMAEDRKLQEAIRCALDCATQPERDIGLSLTKRGSMRKMGLIVRRIAAGSGDSRAAVSISIRDADIAPDVGPEMMRQIFDLTPAEAGVARRLTEGLSLEDTALALDISHNTARAHLRSIFSKSGIKRQTELVRLVLNSAVML